MLFQLDFVAEGFALPSASGVHWDLLHSILKFYLGSEPLLCPPRLWTGVNRICPTINSHAARGSKGLFTCSCLGGLLNLLLIGLILFLTSLNATSGSATECRLSPVFTSLLSCLLVIVDSWVSLVTTLSWVWDPHPSYHHYHPAD